MSFRPLPFRHAAVVSAFVALSAAAPAASAAPMQWFFSGVTFTDGASAQGSFFFDGTNFSGWDIESFRLPGAPGFPEVTPYHYTVSTSTLDSTYGLTLSRNGTGPGNLFSLYFNSPLDASGTTTAWAWERTESFGGSMNSHSSVSDFAVTTTAPFEQIRATPAVIAAPVPEPETWALLLVGAGLVGGVARRQKARTLA